MKRMKKGISLLLALVLTLCMFASCSAGGDKAMWYGDQELNEADYAYLMAVIKEYYAYYCYYYYGQDLDAMWEESLEDGKTFKEMLTEAVNDSAKMMLVVERLCEEAGLTIDDEETLAEIDKYMQDLADKYGGEDAMEIELAKLGMRPSTVERYERYNQLLSRLRDYRYGENGVARISREEVRKAFLVDYAKVEGYLYSYLVVDDKGNRAYYQYDFASDYTEEEVASFFTEQYLRISYLRFEKQADAQAAYVALKEDSSAFETYAKTADTAVEGDYVLEEEMSETLYAGISETEPGDWFLSDKEDGYYYVVQRFAFDSSDLTEERKEEVRKAMLDREAKAYFDENYVTVRHILYRDEAKAKEVYDAILAGKTTFKEHEKDTADSGVQYTFTHGMMVDEFDKAAFAMKVGAYELVQTTYGWHLITRLELDEDAYKLTDATEAMSRDLLDREAKKTYEAIKSGKAEFKEPDEDALYSYTEPMLVALAKQDETLQQKLKDAAEGEIIYMELPGYGVYVLRKLTPDDGDLDEVYDTVEEPLVQNAFYAYLEGFFDSVRVDNEVLGRFDIKTAKTLSY